MRLVLIVATAAVLATPALAEGVGVGVGVGPVGAGVTVGQSRDHDRDRERTTVIKEREPADRTTVIKKRARRRNTKQDDHQGTRLTNRPRLTTGAVHLGKIPCDLNATKTGSSRPLS